MGVGLVRRLRSCKVAAAMDTSTAFGLEGVVAKRRSSPYTPGGRTGTNMHECDRTPHARDEPSSAVAIGCVRRR